jgi:putative thiamine transport system permease protein
MLRYAPGLTTGLFLLPILAGVAGTALPAFGWLPAIGGNALTLEPWRQLVAAPGFASALRLTLTSGLLATVLAFAIVCLFCAATYGRRAFRRAQAALAPMLAIPHAALAIGFTFLIAPSGWFARLLSPWATGWERPPDLAIVQDAHGLSLVAGLILKEVPYLVLMAMAAHGQVRARETMAIAETLGYGRFMAWFKLVLPQIYPQIRLPLYAVLAFSLSNVDVALILGPTNPPPLSPLVVRWFTDREIALFFPAAAGACLQLAIVVAAIAAWRGAELLAARLGRGWIARGARGRDAWPSRISGRVLAAINGMLCVGAILGLAIWSFAASWRFPDPLPGRWTTRNWTEHADTLLWPLGNTIGAAVAATLIALVLAIACLENEERGGVRPGARALWLLYAPLIVPQTAFLFGVQVLLVRFGFDGTWFAVVWTHLLFVLPYLFLSLADPWRALDRRYARTALCLGASPWRVLFKVKLPILLRPILIAVAVGFAVSVGQYLTTLFAGAGRFATLTTEAVTLSGSGDRRTLAVLALMQALLPLAIYLLALAIPLWIFRNRRGLRLST